MFPSSPTTILLFLLLGLLPHLTVVAALSSADEWSDFSDNFATDLAPLITLFGEQVTKQFLSESVEFLDNVIFALAPLGILTAVVSAIRLYGSASLKSFIGRAQEAHGVAEAELCSSTSEDVCELWSNGGICRVFGRPKILEFMYTKSRACYQEGFDILDDETPHCGIYPAKQVLTGETPDGSSDRWAEIGAQLRFRHGFAPFPNLSLNVGTRGTSARDLFAAAAAGIVLELSFFGYATWATFYNPGFYTEENTPHLWSFVLGMAGTVFLMLGMGLCARLVEQRSGERRFTMIDKSDGVRPRIFWLQCGDQRVGDQQFRSFAYSEEKREYTTSYLQDERRYAVHRLTSSLMWLAIVLSLLGFVCQFVGFRSLHGSIALYQLACTLVMSAIRALLRSRRLGREKNRLEDFTRDFGSDELDWQAMAIVSDELHGPQRFSPWLSSSSWRLVNSHLDTGLRNSPLSVKAQAMLASSRVQVLLSEAAISSGLVGFRVPVGEDSSGAYAEDQKDALCARRAVKFIQLLEGELPQGQGFAVEPLAVNVDEVAGPVLKFDTNPVARILNIRARLGHLTGDASQPPGTQWDPELQTVSRRLQRALQDAMGYIFDKVPLRSDWKGTRALAWSMVCVHRSPPFGDLALRPFQSVTFPVHFLARRKRQQWKINEYQLGAVMGLWRLSMFRLDPDIDNLNIWRDKARLVARHEPKRKIIQVVGSREHTAATIRLWVAEDGALKHKSVPPDEAGTADLVPFRLSSQFIGGHTWGPYVDEAPFPDWQPPSAAEVSLIALETPATLLEVLAQDIFSAFMFEAASVMDPLSEISMPQPLGSSRYATWRGLSNPHIDALARILCESGLATEEAALMSIVPALFHHRKLPSLDESVDQLLSDANSLRANQQYEQGEAQLKGLFNICSLQHHEKVVRALGELYRHASKSPTESHRDFGLRSMGAIREKLTPRGAALKLSEAGSEALIDYEQLAEFLSSSSRRNEYPPGRRNRLQLPMSAVLELHDGLGPPEEGRGRSRLKTLMVLEMYDTAERNSPVLHELLFTAIALRHAEVLEDLRALNPDLVLERPAVAAALWDSAEPLSTSIKARFCPEPLPILGRTPPKEGTVGFLALAWAASQLEGDGHLPGEAADVLRTILDWAGLTKNDTDAGGNTALMYAVGSGNAAAVDILLECGADFHVANGRGETALSRAVSAGHYSVAERILKEGHEKASLPPAYLYSALSVAFFAYKQPFIELLLRNGAGIDDLDERGESLLFRALTPFMPFDPHGRGLFPSQDRDRGLVPLLLENGAAAGDLLPDILGIAINHVIPDWIRCLQTRGYDVVDILAEKGALTATLKAAFAARGGAHALDGRELPFNLLIQLLLEIGVPVSPGDLHRAIRARIPDDVLATLVDKGQPAFIDAVLEDYGTPLQILLNDAFWDGPAAARERVLGLLIKAGCDVNLGSAYSQATPLQTVCARVRTPSQGDSEGASGTPPREPPPDDHGDELAMMLIRAGADVNLTVAAGVNDGRGLIRSTPLELACVTGKAGLVRALLDAGAKVNTPGGEFGPPLQAACLQVGQRRDGDNVEIISMLIKAGADINAVGEPGGTAIAVAAHFLLPGAVKTLLDAGADPALPDGDKARGAYNDAWDALEVRTNPDLMALLVAFFNIQRSLPSIDVDRDSEAADKTRDQIGELLSSRSSTRRGSRQPNGD